MIHGLGDSVPGQTAAMAPPSIDFHFNVDHRVTHACRVVRKAHAAGMTVLVFASDEQRRAQIDLALWTFSALDFLPHVTLPSPLAERTPIWLARTPPPASRQLLLLLDDEIQPRFAEWFARFTKIVEVVCTDAEDRARARLRFKAYRDAGFVPVAHEIGGA